MIDLLLVVLIVAAAIQSTGNGRAAACTFAGLTVAFHLISVPDELYHLAAAATDGVCVLLLSRMTGGITKDLQRLCQLSIALNFAGWVAWEMYLPSSAYNLAFLYFYSITIISLIMRRVSDAHTTSTTNRPWLPFHFYSSFISDREQEGDART